MTPNETKQNTESFVKQFRRVLMGLYSGQFHISSIIIKREFDNRIMSPGAPVDIGNRILIVKYNALRKNK